MPTVTYCLEPDLTPAEFIDVLARSTLAERRPVSDSGTIQDMLRNADLIVTARLNGLLVGVSRAITDFAYCTYLSDLAVDERHQRQGIGRQLIQRTHETAGLHTTLILLSAPKAQSYYPHIGMTRHESCWVIARKQCHECKENSMKPEEAIKRINESVTVEMLVQRTKSCTGSRQVFLDSEASHRDPKNLGVVVTEKSRGKFAEAGIGDPAAHYSGKTIRVRGTVVRREDRPYIDVDDPTQIELTK